MIADFHKIMATQSEANKKSERSYEFLKGIEIEKFILYNYK